MKRTPCHNHPWLFPAAGILLAGTAFFFLEMILRIIPTTTPPPKAQALEWFVSSMCEPDPDGPGMRIIHPLLREPRSILPRTNDHFRVVIAGGSAAQSWPLEHERGIAMHLERCLNAVGAGQSAEVICIAGNTFGSHRVRWSVDEIGSFRPDHVIIMSGNNEFLEHFLLHGRPERVWNRWRRMLLRLELVRRSIRIQRPSRRPDRAVFAGFHEFEHTEWPLCPTSAPEIAFPGWRKTTLDSLTRQRILEAYRRNIEAMIRTIRDRGGEPLLVTMPVNLRNWVPGLSVHGIPADDPVIDSWYQAFMLGKRNQQAGDYRLAEQAYIRSIERDDQYAETWFRLGECRFAQGDTTGARAAFEAALERDAYASRCLPETNRMIRDMAAEMNVILIDLDGALSERSPGGIAGSEFFLDHVHLNAAGIAVAVELFFHALMGPDIQPEELPEQTTGFFGDRISWDGTSFDVIRQVLRMALMHNQVELSLNLCGALNTWIERMVDTEEASGVKRQTLEGIERRTEAVRRALKSFVDWETIRLLDEEEMPDDSERTRQMRRQMIDALRLVGDPSVDAAFETGFIQRMGIETDPGERHRYRIEHEVRMQ
ncbi:tetratricopeptide repeat protein [bacterium]|nr:tetratricopeptide repeat protein [candidate division CSSED10-310 bacterium]